MGRESLTLNSLVRSFILLLTISRRQIIGGGGESESVGVGTLIM